MARKLRVLVPGAPEPGLERSGDDARAAYRRRRIALGAGALLSCFLVLLAGTLAAAAVRRELDRRLVLAGAGANAGLVEIEAEQLSLLRAIIFTSGIGHALADVDAASLNRLVTPLQANSNVPMVDMVRPDGAVVFAVRSKGAPAPVASRKGVTAIARSLATWKGSRQGRFTTLVQLQGAPVLLTIGPVVDHNAPVGVAMVMTPLADVLGRLAAQIGATLSAYAPNGALEATTATEDPPAVAAGVMGGVVSTNSSSLREIPGEVREADGGLIIDHTVVAVLGVSASDDSAQAALVVDLVAGAALVLGAVTAGWWGRGRRQSPAGPRAR